MRSSSIIFLCLLTSALYLSYRNTYLCSSSSSSSIVFTGRPYMRQLSTSTSDYRNQRQKIKMSRQVVDSKKMRSNVEGRSMDGNIYYEKRDGDELVYHIDYHGVTTHPTPTPKHPKP